MSADLPTLDEATAAYQRIQIAHALDLHGWQLRPAARELGITANRLRRLITELELEPDYFERNPGVGHYQRKPWAGAGHPSKPTA